MQLSFAIIDYLVLMVLLCIPRYYASQAATVIALAGRVNGVLYLTSLLRDDEASMQAPEPAHLNPSARSPLMSQVSNIDARDFNISKELQTGWKNFIVRCRADWVITSSFSSTFLVASPAALQMAHDPATRFFVYLAIFCAFSAIAHSLIHLFYFHNSETQTGKFAKIWAQGASGNEKFFICAQWVVLALPVVALTWGAIFLFLAFISSAWHGRPSNPAVNSIGLVLQLIITMFFVAVLGCLLWTTLILKKFNPRDVSGTENSADSAS